MGYPRQEYWSGLPFPSPGDLPDPGIEPRSPALQADALPSEPPGSLTLYVLNYTIAVYVTPALGAVKHSGTGSEVLEKESEANLGPDTGGKSPHISGPNKSVGLMT